MSEPSAELIEANVRLLEARKQMPQIPEAETIHSAFHKRLKELQNKVASAPDIAEEKNPAPGPNAAQIASILIRSGFPKRHVDQLAIGLHGLGLEKAKEISKTLRPHDSLILLIGNRGPGKTQIATFWASELVKGEMNSVRYAKCADLIGEIKTTWHDGGKNIGTEFDVIRKYRKSRYLVIDEFHEKGGSDWESRCLINLIDHRYDDMLATVIIANLNEQQAIKEINPSILDRANQTGGLIVCDWPSYRL